MQSKYAGLQEVTIKQGDAVRQGAEIGLITDDVLQFFIYENDVAVDPFLYLDYQTS